MTGELQPAGDSASPVPRDELRVSYDDRDRVAEQLRVAAGDGRLTAEEPVTTARSLYGRPGRTQLAISPVTVPRASARCQSP